MALSRFREGLRESGGRRVLQAERNPGCRGTLPVHVLPTFGLDTPGSRRVAEAEWRVSRSRGLASRDESKAVDCDVGAPAAAPPLQAEAHRKLVETRDGRQRRYTEPERLRQRFRALASGGHNLLHS